MPKVYILILNYNGGDDTIACLKSLQAITYANAETVVIDNASADGSVARIRAAFPDITVLQNKENLGFAAGNNVGIIHALERGADYIFLLNNDTVVDPGVIDELVRVGEGDESIGILGSLIYYYDSPQKVWFAGGKVYWPLGTNRHLTSIPAKPREVDFITGCAFMVKRAVVEKMGAFDSDYFLYYEDADWSVRAARAGFKLVVVPASVVWHKEMGTVGHRSPLHEYYVARNNLLFMDKNAATFNYVIFLPIFLLKITIKTILFCARRQFRLVGPIFRGVRDYYTGMLGKQT